MLFLGIDQHARQLTVSLRDQHGDVILVRQISTQPENILDFFDQLTRRFVPVVTLLKGHCKSLRCRQCTRGEVSDRVQAHAARSSTRRNLQLSQPTFVLTADVEHHGVLLLNAPHERHSPTAPGMPAIADLQLGTAGVLSCRCTAGLVPTWSEGICRRWAPFRMKS